MTRLNWGIAAACTSLLISAQPGYSGSADLLKLSPNEQERPPPPSISTPPLEIVVIPPNLAAVENPKLSIGGRTLSFQLIPGISTEADTLNYPSEFVGVKACLNYKPSNKILGIIENVGLCGSIVDQITPADFFLQKFAPEIRSSLTFRF
jgi:hypothetical protein